MEVENQRKKSGWDMWRDRLKAPLGAIRRFREGATATWWGWCEATADFLRILPFSFPLNYFIHSISVYWCY